MIWVCFFIRLSGELPLFIFCFVDEREREIAQQVIMQVWISTHFGVISERPPRRMKTFLFIKGIFTPRMLGCKPHFDECLSFIPSGFWFGRRPFRLGGAKSERSWRLVVRTLGDIWVTTRAHSRRATDAHSKHNRESGVLCTPRV